VRNAALPVARRIEFRMGINLGEIVVEGEQIHGDGINIAVRLEGVAEAGGICISEVVYKQLKNKLVLEYEDLGEHALKNIAEPVRVWRIRMEESGSPASGVQSPMSEVPSSQPRRVGSAPYAPR
jgi:adenylate cyclase